MSKRETLRQRSQQQANEQLARSLGVNSTPTLFISGIRVQNSLDFQEIQNRISSELAQQP